MAFALADKLPNGQEQCETIQKLVEDLAPPHPPPQHPNLIKTQRSKTILPQDIKRNSTVRLQT
ncbi:MAG: hypothetical protein JSR93_11185 [Verrucomicrobia bacterium]|nr:hypothetical protein [Verrucomicrobiota bacterium]